MDMEKNQIPLGTRGKMLQKQPFTKKELFFYRRIVPCTGTGGLNGPFLT